MVNVSTLVELYGENTTVSTIVNVFDSAMSNESPYVIYVLCCGINVSIIQWVPYSLLGLNINCCLEIYKCNFHRIKYN